MSNKSEKSNEIRVVIPEFTDSDMVRDSLRYVDAFRLAESYVSYEAVADYVEDSANKGYSLRVWLQGITHPSNQKTLLAYKQPEFYEDEQAALEEAHKLAIETLKVLRSALPALSNRLEAQRYASRGFVPATHIPAPGQKLGSYINNIPKTADRFVRMRKIGAVTSVEYIYQQSYTFGLDVWISFPADAFVLSDVSEHRSTHQRVLARQRGVTAEERIACKRLSPEQEMTWLIDQCDRYFTHSIEQIVRALTGDTFFKLNSESKND